LFVGYSFGEIICIRDSYFYQKGVLCFFFVHELGRLEDIVLSIIMLRFQYSLKLSFSSTLAGVYFYYYYYYYYHHHHHHHHQLDEKGDRRVRDATAPFRK
jgi:hypothetical protein